MPRVRVHKSEAEPSVRASAIHAQRLRNLEKARAARAAKALLHPLRAPRVRRARVPRAAVGVPVLRSASVVGSNPIAAALALHGLAQQLKPVTNLKRLGSALGIAGKVDSALSSNAVGRAIQGAANFAQNTLGYGRHRKVGRPRKHRRPKRA